jgi:SSS family solute:Na+ symporter
MNALTVSIVIGMVAIGVIGVAGRRATKLDEWTVSGRNFARWRSWFLQAGESLTTFSFLGLSGIAFGGGVSATFALAYLSISAIGLYFVAPRLWRLGKGRGYLTMADFFVDRFNSPSLGKVVAVVGAIFLLPYLELQITGLGLIVELATGSASSRGLSMVIARVLVVSWTTFFEIPIGSWDSGFIALGPNLVVLVIAEVIRRRLLGKARTVVKSEVPAVR